MVLLQIVTDHRPGTDTICWRKTVIVDEQIVSKSSFNPENEALLLALSTK